MEFEGKRAKLYSKLEWANDSSYIDAIIAAGRFQASDKVLDVGTGTGIMASHIAPVVSEVVGIDISSDMLALNRTDGHIRLMLGDIRNSSLDDSYFDKVVARQVFHHILENTQKAMDECYRVLRSGGIVVVAEGVPPTPEIKRHYKLVFSKKEDRLTFMESDLEAMLQRSGFVDVKTIIVWKRQMSIRKWLTNSGLGVREQNDIFGLYLRYKTICTKAYNMTLADNDCFIDIKQAIVTGRKE